MGTSEDQILPPTSKGCLHPAAQLVEKWNAGAARQRMSIGWAYFAHEIGRADMLLLPFYSTSAKCGMWIMRVRKDAYHRTLPPASGRGSDRSVDDILARETFRSTAREYSDRKGERVCPQKHR